jgi:hypothetical protein
MSTDLLQAIIKDPIPYAHALGLTKLNDNLHKQWIIDIFNLEKNDTIQGHRGSYKTTCLRVGIGLRMIAKPFENLILQRKSDGDVKDLINAVSKDLKSDICMNLMNDIYGYYPKFIADNNSEIELSSYRGAMGRQLLGLGIGSSITGKHGHVITDDIVTLKDRLSAAERERTKAQYMELVNIASEEGQHIFNTGTPWHKDDAFVLMPPPRKHDVYSTGIISPDRIQERKDGMSPSLFSANYELKHVSDGDVLFKEPEYGEFPIGIKTFCQIDAAYGGEDSTAVTIMGENEGKLYTVGWLMPGHIENNYTSIISKIDRYQVNKISCENNADKGYLKKELSKLTNVSINTYHESMNKYYKITTFGRTAWKRVVIDMANSDMDYISQIMDYNENSKHDDAPDSFASLVRWKFSKSGINVSINQRI